MSTMQFQRATRKKAKLRLGVSGPAGSGKTTAALAIASGLGGRIALLDTEAGSASLYSDSCDFDSMNLEAPYSPERFVQAIKAAEGAGYDVLILDSVTPEWSGPGGCLELNEQIAQTRYRGNTWSAWSETKPMHRDFIDAILHSKLHVIATMRSKTETVQTESKQIKKLGMKSEQESGFDYEMTIVFEIDHQTHLATATKDRSRLFTAPTHLTEKVGKTLRDWLDSGVEAPPSEAEIAAKRQQGLSVKFAQALNSLTESGKTEEENEAAISAAVFAVHEEVREIGADEYKAIWNMIPSDSRKALKHYIEAAKSKVTILNNGRSAA